MGQGISKEDEDECVELRELGAVRLASIGHQFNELYSQSKGNRGVLLDRAAFARHFQVPVILGDRLFEAFDTEKNGVVSFEEFARGLAVCLHGSTAEKCELLFNVFNLAGDDGVSRDELQFMLHATLESAFTIVKALTPRTSAVVVGETLTETVKRCVDEAFETCDLTGNGKLLPNEFEMWMRRKPELLDSILNWRSRQRPTREASAGHPTLKTASPDSLERKPLIVTPSPSFGRSEVPSKSQSTVQMTSAAPQVDALGSDDVGILEKLLNNDATMESIDMKDASFLGGSLPSVSAPVPGTIAELTQESLEPGSGASILPVTGAVVPLDMAGNDATVDVSLALAEAAADVEPLPLVETGTEPVLHDTTLNLMDEVGLNTPSSTPSTSRHATPAPAGRSSPTGKSSPAQSSSPALIRTQGSSTPNSSTPTMFPTPENVQKTAAEEGSPLEVDGRLFRRKKPTLPAAVFDSSGAHLTSSTTELSPSTAVSPLFDSDEPEHYSVVDQIATERRRTSWLASPQTQQLLANMATNSQLSRVDQSFLTMPGLLVEGSQSDPVRDLLVRYGLEAEARDRHILNVDSVTMDQVGLQKLLKGGCYRAALELTGRFLSAHGQGLGQRGQPALHTHRTLQMWLARVALLMKLGQFSVAHNELKAFGNFDSPDMYFDYYPDAYPNRSGTMVPFSLRLLQATIPQYAGAPAEAVDRLQHIKDYVARIVENLRAGLSEDGQMELDEIDNRVSLELWDQRLVDVKYAMANALLLIKDYDLAIQTFLSVAETESSSAPALLSLIGRIYLQLGDLKSCQEAFHAAEAKAGEATDLCRKLHAMHKGFIDVSAGRYPDAFRHFQGVLRVESFNGVAINNMAVCLLYTGKLTEAVQVLEELVWKDPPTHLQAASICNLCTLYELQSARANDKKLALLRLVAEHCGDGFPADSLKLST